ncbi:hypothetical protein CFC21_005971 [Triticum aestivum]|uniref:Defensin n=3 Tax=Triticum TaxID=4564 RepID=A0A9R0QNU7_TRITD|nr:hypothetical protein CFC21_005971 [Triticum aestivum]VAH14882.1 unnamed protein product [Triticum turgidum subsp. durum]
MAPKSNATRMVAVFVVLMIMSSTLSSSSCYARTIEDGAPVCSRVEKCQDRCQTACSISGKPSTGAYCNNDQCCCA